MPSVHTRELLVEEGGFLYDWNAYNDDLPYRATAAGRRILVVPYTLTYNDVSYTSGLTPIGFVEYCRRGIDELAREGATHPKMMSMGPHGRFTRQAGRTSALREIVEHALHRDDIWIAQWWEIAQWWVDHYPDSLSEADGAARGGEQRRL